MTSATADSAAEILSNLNINAGDWPPNLLKNLHLLSPDQVLHVPNPVHFFFKKFNKYHICIQYTYRYTNMWIICSVLLFLQIEVARMLLEMGQSHLFQHWAESGVEDDQKKAFFAQVSVFFLSYGILQYSNVIFFKKKNHQNWIFICFW